MAVQKARDTNYFKIGAIERPHTEDEIYRRIYSVLKQVGNN